MQRILKRVIVITVIFILILSLSACGQTAVEPGNKVLNSGFEESLGKNGMPMQWQRLSYRADSQKEAMGQNAPKVELVSGGYMSNKAVKLTNMVDDDLALVQKIPVKNNAFYRLSAMVKDQGTQDGAGASMSIFENVDARSLVATNTGEKWKKITMYIQIEDGIKQVTLSLRKGYFGSMCTGTAWFDNIEFTQVSEKDIPQQYSVRKISPPQEVKPSPSPKPTMSLQGLGGFYAVLIAGLYVALVFFIVRRKNAQLNPLDQKANDKTWLWFALGIPLLIRIPFALFSPGYVGDMSCWQGWGDRMITTGPVNFYVGKDFFCDYPPIYMYLLSVPAAIMKFLGITVSSGGYYTPLANLFLRAMPIAADMGIAYLIFKWLRPKMGVRTAGWIAFIAALSPALVVDSSVWGQIDSVMVLPILLFIYFLVKNRVYLATSILTVAILTKPQALFFGPILAWVMIWNVVQAIGKKGEKSIGKALLDIFLCILLSAGIIGLATLLPSIGMKDPFFIFKKLIGTVDQYPYASLNAANFHSLIGGNWAPIADKSILGFTYTQIGYIAIPGAITLSIWHFIRNRQDRGHLFVNAALLCATIILFSTRMHERYLLPTVILLIGGFIYLKDKRLLFLSAGFSVVVMLNSILVLLHNTPKDAWIEKTDGGYYTAFVLLSFLMVLLYALLIWVAFSKPRKVFLWEDQKETPKKGGKYLTQKPVVSAKKVETQPVTSPVEQISAFESRLSPPGKNPVRRFEVIGLLAIIVAYSLLAFFNLGSTKAPQKGWIPQNFGEMAQIELAQPTKIENIWVYHGILTGSIHYQLSKDGKAWTDKASMNFEEGSMNVWRDRTIKDTFKYMRIEYVSGNPKILEVCFTDEKYKQIKVVRATPVVLAGLPNTPGFSALVDEQDTFPLTGRPSFMDGMYFDEIYHARTAYEFLNAMKPDAQKQGEDLNIYENTHPPLGKTLIGVGVSWFGMTPFGWRFMGTVAGIAMIPLMYLFARRLFKKPLYAFLAAGLISLDCMHFAQTRIATIDSFSVLFIMAMYYFMYIFLQNSKLSLPWWKSFVPLALSGIFFGIGAATKWICLYAGAGLAVMIAIAVYRLLKDRATAISLVGKKGISPEQHAMIETVRKGTVERILQMGLWCILFFLIIPSAIYYASYIPIFTNDHNFSLSHFWELQKNMYDYHSRLNATHPFASKWFTWLVDARPIWYYSGNYLPKGYQSDISSMGNPIIWVAGFGAVLWTMWKYRTRLHWGYAATVGAIVACVFINPLYSSVVEQTDMLKSFVRDINSVNGLIFFLAFCFVAYVCMYLIKVIFNQTNPVLKLGSSVDNYKSDLVIPFLMIGFASQLLPWMLVNRCVFIYHYFASVPFIILILVYFIRAMIKKNPKNKQYLWVFLVVCAVFFALLYPAISGLRVSDGYAKFLRNVMAWQPFWFLYQGW